MLRTVADRISWAHEICKDDNEERAIVIGSMNEMAYVLQAWLPLLVWQQVDAPQYQKGFITVTVLSMLLIITTFTVKYLWKRDLLRYVHDCSLSVRNMLNSSVGTNEPPWRTTDHPTLSHLRKQKEKTQKSHMLGK